jgi:hypothetical protein
LDEGPEGLDAGLEGVDAGPGMVGKQSEGVDSQQKDATVLDVVLTYHNGDTFVSEGGR